MYNITAYHAQTFFEKSKGLLGAEKPYPLFFQTRWGIHTFGMRFPIDVVILTNDNTIFAIKQNLQPNRFFFWNPFYRNVLELPVGTIQTERIKIGGKIHFILQKA